MRDRTCIIDGCEREGTGTHGWCQMHAKRWRRNGTMDRVSEKPGPPRGWCKIDGCPARLHAGGYCTSHFLRWKRHGDPIAGASFRDHRPLSERFMDNVNVTDGCWLWTGSTVDGYGRVRSEGITDTAHRVSWTIHVGPIPDGMHIDHLCHNADPTCVVWDECPHRACVRPSHLEPVPPGENSRRAGLRQTALGLRKRRVTHCPYGHEYTEANSYLYRGRRHCRACSRRKAAARRAARRATV